MQCLINNASLNSWQESWVPLMCEGIVVSHEPASRALEMTRHLLPSPNNGLRSVVSVVPC